MPYEPSRGVSQRYFDFWVDDHQGTSNPNSIHFPVMTIHGDHGNNFKFIESADMGFLNTTKRGPSLAFKFGATRYNTTQDQCKITKSGPVLSLGAV